MGLKFLDGDQQELSQLIENNKLSADLVKECDISYKSDFGAMVSTINSATVGTAQRVYNSYKKVPMNAWLHNGNRITNTIISYVKEGHYTIALEHGEKGYFKARPFEAVLIKQECERLIKQKHDFITQPATDFDKHVLTDYIMDQQKKLLHDTYTNYNGTQFATENADYLQVIAQRAQILKEILYGKAQYSNQTYPLSSHTKDTVTSFGMSNVAEQLYGNQLQHSIYGEVHTLLTYAATVKNVDSLKAENITICALSAQEAAQLGDIKTALYFANKAWKYAHPDIKKSFTRVSTKERVVFTPELLKKAHEHHLKQEPFDLTSLKQEQSLFPEAEEFLVEHGVDSEEFNKTIDAQVTPEVIKKAIQNILQQKNLPEKNSTETPEQIALHFYSLIGKKIVDNLTHPHMFIKRSFIDPIVAAGSSLGNFLDKHGKTLVQTAMLSADVDDGIDNPELRKLVVQGTDLLHEDIKKAADVIQQGVSEIPQKIQTLLTLPPEQAEELVATLVSDLITFDIFSTAFSTVFKELDTIRTSEKITELVDEMGESRLIEALSNKVSDSFRKAEALEIETSGATIQKRTNYAAKEADVASKTAPAVQKSEQIAQKTSASQTTKVGEKAGKTGTIVEGQFKPLGRGSTGRSVPKDLHEQLALREIMSDPSQGKKLDITMTDPRWLEKDGWYKRTWYSEELKKDIHYVAQEIDEIIVAVDDFKFIDKK